MQKVRKSGVLLFEMKSYLGYNLAIMRCNNKFETGRECDVVKVSEKILVFLSAGATFHAGGSEYGFASAGYDGGHCG